MRRIARIGRAGLVAGLMYLLSEGRWAALGAAAGALGVGMWKLRHPDQEKAS